MSSKKILVIDGKESISDTCRMALDNIGYEVFCAYGGEQAIEMAMLVKFNLVIVDAMLPGNNVNDTFDVIRQADPELIGLLVVCHADMDMVVKAMNHGFSRVLEAPLNTTELVKAVQEAFALSALREENSRLQTMLPLYKLGEKFIAATSLKEVYELLLDAISLQINVPAISVMMFVEEDECMRVVASRGMDEAVARKVAVKSGEQIAGWVYEHGEAVI